MMMWLAFLFMLVSPVYASEAFDSVLQRGEAYLTNNQYFLALEDFTEAQTLAETPLEQSYSAGELGLTYYRMRHFDKAESLLRQAISVEKPPKSAIGWWVALAEMAVKQGDVAQAKRFYRQAHSIVGDDEQLKLNLALAQVPLLPVEQRLNTLQVLGAAVDRQSDFLARTQYALNLASQAQRLGEAGVMLAYEYFSVAKNSTQPRVQAEAFSGLAQLYEQQKRPEEALRLNRQAIQVAQTLNAHDLLLDLEWQQGRLQRVLKHVPNAIAAYQRAVDHIESIRSDIPVEYHNGHSSFRETLEPVYLGLADLLLQQSAQQALEQQKTPLLRQVREVLERLKQSEVEDFLGGRCGVQRTAKALDAVEANTAIIYPVILPERLELIVSIGSKLYQFTRPVRAATLRLLAKIFVNSLRNRGSFIHPAQSLYRALLEPVQPLLQEKQVQTLVMVPDGVLRSIPLGALFDGEQFVLERYAVATSVGLTLLNPAPLSTQQNKALLVGMSAPGDVVEHLPATFLSGLKNERGLTFDVSQSAAQAGSNPLLRDQIQSELSLPGVEKEMTDLQIQIDNTTLINENFTVNRFKQQLEDESYNVIHIASHGVFGKTAATSFIMAYDDVININDLERILKSDQFREQPLEMLTLSACQTAEGNDRTPLGLSGIALKAKVGSALGTLWSVSDKATAKLMATFYQHLNQSGLTKAKALRQAQLAILHDDTMTHPFYWAPFILVGNWL